MVFFVLGPCQKQLLQQSFLPRVQLNAAEGMIRLVLALLLLLLILIEIDNGNLICFPSLIIAAVPAGSLSARLEILITFYSILRVYSQT
jgi:hypothetical protein